MAENPATHGAATRADGAGPTNDLIQHMYEFMARARQELKPSMDRISADIARWKAEREAALNRATLR